MYRGLFTELYSDRYQHNPRWSRLHKRGMTLSELRRGEDK